MIPFSVLSNEEMQEFADENQVFSDDKKFQSIMIAMAMWKPWFLKNLAEKVKWNEYLEVEITSSAISKTSFAAYMAVPVIKTWI